MTHTHTHAHTHTHTHTVFFFGLMYNVMDKNVTKNIFILNLFILFAKLRLKYSIKALL